MNFETSEEYPKQDLDASEVAGRMYDLADGLNIEKEPERYQAFNESGTAISQGDYDKGQRILEQGGQWDDDLRAVAVDTNKMDQANREGGGKSMNLAGATEIIQSYADRLAESRDLEDRRGAIEIESILGGLNRPGTEGLDETLKYVESLLESRASSNIKRTPEIIKDWQERRDVRDVLFEEKKRRLKKIEADRAISDHAKLESDQAAKDQAALDELRKHHGFDGGAEKIDNLDPLQEAFANLGSAEDIKAQTKANAYNPNLGIATIMEGLKGVYPDQEALGKRLREIKSEYGVAIEKSQQDRPDYDAHGHSVIALKAIIKSLSPQERALMEEGIDKNLILKDRNTTDRIHIQHAMGDFLRFLNQIKE